MGRGVSSSGLEAGTGRRHVLTIAAAVLLPLFMLAGLLLYTTVNAGREQLERTSQEAASRVMSLIDAQMADEIRLARMLTSARPVALRDLPGSYERAAYYAQASGSWRGVRLTDPKRGVELFDTARPYGAERPAGADALAYAATGGGQPQVGEIAPWHGGGYAIPLHVPVHMVDGSTYVATVDLDAASIQRTAAAQFPSASLVSAVVDGQGRFLSRTLDFDNRVGRPASVGVRTAVKKGGSGLYRGTTLEGKPSFTAYVTSPVRGWSAHVAIPPEALDAARGWGLLIWAVVAIGCLAISGGLVRFALQDMARDGEARERARQSQKMEAVGRLTGGIAHDFNNLLTVIITGLTLVQKRLDPEDGNRRQVGAALEAARRGARLTGRLLAFSRTHRLEVQAVDLATTLESVSELLRQSLGVGVRLQIEVDPAARWVMTDGNQLELAVLNLAVNARDAMPDGGTLTITARPHVGVKGRAAWPCVRLAVSDSGEGMSAEVLDRAADPFFTTKPVGKGTGLGLSQVQELARQSGGEMELDSRPGEGTTVALLLPPGEPAAQPAPAIPVRTELLKGALILLVDDEADVRAALADILDEAGALVIQAGSGEAALTEAAKATFSLVITDFLMPGMTGGELARRLRAARSDQKLLVVSGHLDTEALERDAPGVEVLTKPVDAEVLLARAAAVMAS